MQKIVNKVLRALVMSCVIAVYMPGASLHASTCRQARAKAAPCWRLTKTGLLALATVVAAGLATAQYGAMEDRRMQCLGGRQIDGCLNGQIDNTKWWAVFAMFTGMGVYAALACGKSLSAWWGGEQRQLVDFAQRSAFLDEEAPQPPHALRNSQLVASLRRLTASELARLKMRVEVLLATINQAMDEQRVLLVPANLPALGAGQLQQPAEEQLQPQQHQQIPAQQQEEPQHEEPPQPERIGVVKTGGYAGQDVFRGQAGQCKQHVLVDGVKIGVPIKNVVKG